MRCYRYRYAVMFMLACAALVYLGLRSASAPIVFLALYCALSAALLSIAYWTNCTRLFFKSAKGRIALWSYALYLPYFLLNLLLFSLSRLIAREPACHEVGGNLYLGRRLAPGEKALSEKLGIRSVLDLTCEFPEPRHMREADNYLCLPVLDTFAPTVGQLKEGVEWLRARTAEGAVYVHCASGHGRSATFVVALTLSENPETTVEAAIAMLAQKRPGIKLSKDQMTVLHEFKSTLPA